MIVVNGEIKELSIYLPKIAKKIILDYVREINSDTPEGYTELWGKHVYGRVMSYYTLAREQCKIEAHNRYVDIQITVVGAEKIEVYQRKKLKEAKE